MQNWDYSSDGFYFITICTCNRIEYFGNVIDAKMELNEYGKIADMFWLEMIEHFPFVESDEYVVMPNHVHGIIRINNPDFLTEIIHENGHAGVVETIHDNGHAGVVETIHELSLQQPGATCISRRQMLLSKIIGRYKMQSAKQINQLRETTGQPFWQSRFYDHIIRNQESLERIRHYIRVNPEKWFRDRNNEFGLNM